ncbi:ribokinase [Egibacter rhizosphaerae]|uniref:Ribokinase n=1 Tax=Egibacter rhizosphaerae TaxID=1670831 RepID=A0A411YL58_9ACTN|nr:ribokinase [Egibacter rhizosphaerae]
MLVVGSANADIVVPVERHPRVGETVIGGDHYRAAGGKGANQAVACARLGARTRFVGRVGDDDHGRLLIDALTHDGIELSGLRVTDDAPSGLALIVVGPDGDNSIVVSPGANARLSRGDLDGTGIEGAGAVLLQLEVPLGTVEAAASRARGLVVLNPAPAVPLPSALLARTDVLVPNRGELAVLAGANDEPASIDEAADLARSLDVVDRMVITLGADGAVVVEHGTVTHVPAHSVVARDTTAAGDAFCGALSVALLEGADLVAAARWARVGAALAAERVGAQPSLPTRDEVAEVAPADTRG